MPPEFFKRGPVISAADIDAFEGRIDRRLPADYRDFLLALNGGRPNHHVIRDTATGDIGVKIFFGICEEEYFDIDAECETMQGRIFSHHLSIAIDGLGNRYCVSLGPSDFGCVYFWDHEEEADEGEDPSELNLYLVADSFTELFSRMEPIDPDKYLAAKGIDVEALRNSKKLEMVERGPAITEQDVEAFEGRIYAALPARYREFLLAYNGGRPGPHVIRHRFLGNLHVERFLGICDQEAYDIELAYRNMPAEVSGSLLPIAVDNQGRKIYSTIGSPTDERIYLWTAYLDEPPPYFLANTFEVLWARMEPPDSAG